jgi:UMF1 family MFS transporter
MNGGTVAEATSEPMVNNKREIFGWAMYDWANSAFSTTIGTVFLGPFVASLAAAAGKAFPDGMARIFGIPIAPDSFFPYCISISVGFQVFILPILGAIADYSHRRKQMMRLFATIGAILTILMFFVTGPVWWRFVVYPGKPGFWSRHRFLQFLPSGYRQRGET